MELKISTENEVLIIDLNIDIRIENIIEYLDRNIDELFSRKMFLEKEILTIYPTIRDTYSEDSTFSYEYTIEMSKCLEVLEECILMIDRYIRIRKLLEESFVKIHDMTNNVYYIKKGTLFYKTNKAQYNKYVKEDILN